MVTVIDLVNGLCARDVTQLTRAELSVSLADVGRVQGWLDGVKIAHARRLAELAVESPQVHPAEDLARAQRSSTRDAGVTLRRTETLDAAPAMEHALGAGDLSAAHVDVLGRALHRLTDSEAEQLCADDGQRLARLAAGRTPEQFDRRLQFEVRRLQADGGARVLVRQQRATRLRMWLDPKTGMGCIAGELDPEHWLLLKGRLDRAMRMLFTERQPDSCPDDPFEKLDHLRALALLAITDRRAPAHDSEAEDITLVGSNIELSVVIDWHTIRHGVWEHSHIDVGTEGVDLPWQTYARWACLADITPVFLDPRGLPLRVGRATRLANRGQRRALCAIYATCAITGCTVASRHCQPHHIHWWRHGGKTDIDNLLPLCATHHHAVHEGGWHIHVDGHRTLTITYPNGHTEHMPLQRRATPVGASP